MTREADRALRPMTSRLLEAALVLALFGLVTIYALRLLWDIDIFWHVVAGRLLRRDGLGVSEDTFSAIDPGRPWVPLVWGYHVLTSYLDDWGGLQALRIFHAVVQVAAFALFWWSCRFRLGEDRRGLGALRALVLLALLALLYADRFRARPHVFNLLFEVMLLPRLAEGARNIDRRSVAFVFALFFLWANIHGGGAFVFAVALAAIPAAATVEAWAGVPGAKARLRSAAAWYAAIVVACLISPLFVRSVIHTFGMVEAAEEYTYEWHPSWRLFFSGWLPAHYAAAAFPTVLAVLFAFPIAKLITKATEGRLALARALDHENLAALLLGVAFTYLSHRSIRFIYMATYTAILVGPPIARAFAEVRVRPAVTRVAWALAGLGMVAMTYQSRITGLYGTLGRSIEVVAGSEALQADRFPVAQADYLERTHFHGKIFCQAMWGGYLLYRLWPAVTVLADGRGNYDAEVTRDLRALGNRENMSDPTNGPGILAIYERYAPDAIVHHHPTWPTGYVPPAEKWVLVEEDRIGMVWLRPALAPAQAP